MSLAYYYDLLSPPARTLHIILKMSGVQFEDCPVALLKGEHMTEDYKNNINRFQKVPCIIDGGFKLAESIAILRYLSAQGKIPEHLYSKNLVEQARIDECLEWQQTTLASTCALYFRAKWLEPTLSGGKTQPSPEKLETLKTRMETNLDLVEKLWLESSDFLCGNQMTVADIFAACVLEQTRIAEYDVRAQYPKIRAWLKRVREACNPYFDYAHQTVYKIGGSEPN
uniref:Glutathione S-transferase theta-1 n=1 Tax=Stomoxys calcitrans TaxID=35570 RepID=A0A1I8NXH2_STOCA